jgi:hypothetical protein
MTPYAIISNLNRAISVLKQPALTDLALGILESMRAELSRDYTKDANDLGAAIQEARK